jgi:hypothetical protein
VSRRDMDVRLGHDPVRDEGCRADAFELVVSDLERDRLRVVVTADLNVPAPRRGVRGVLLESLQSFLSGSCGANQP